MLFANQIFRFFIVAVFVAAMARTAVIATTPLLEVRAKLSRTISPYSGGWTPHWTARSAVVASHVRWTGPGSTVLIGDSIMEMVNPAAGMVNAGFGGATASDIATLLRTRVIAQALAENPPARAVIQAGRNDAIVGVDADEIAATVMAIAANMRRLGAEPHVFAVPPIEEDKTSALSASAAVSINAALKRAADRSGVLFIDPYATIRTTDGLTYDGIHLTRSSTAVLFNAIIGISG